MKALKPFASLLTVLSAIVLSSAAQAEEWITYKAQPRGSSISIDGTSSIHDWTVETTLIGGTFQYEAGSPIDPSVAGVAELKTQPKAAVRIPVRTLKSGKKRMDEVMHAAMDEPSHKFIAYELVSLKPTDKDRVAGAPLNFEAKGKLTVSGTTRDVVMPVVITSDEADTLKVNGKVTIKMTDYGIEPPAPKIALGLIKTGDEVELAIEWLTGKAKK